MCCGRVRSYGWREGVDVAESQRNSGRRRGSAGDRHTAGQTREEGIVDARTHTHTVAGSVMRKGGRWEVGVGVGGEGGGEMGKVGDGRVWKVRGGGSGRVGEGESEGVRESESEMERERMSK